VNAAIASSATTITGLNAAAGSSAAVEAPAALHTSATAAMGRAVRRSGRARR
jgi:hypothetical protein